MNICDTATDKRSGFSTPSAAVLFTTKTPYVFPSQNFMIPLDWKRYQLSQLINKALSLARPIPFDFLVRGAILRTKLGECRAENGISEEDTVEIEYFESVLPPQRMTKLPHEDWVSSISCRISHASGPHYLCVVPSLASTDESVLIASASHDLTGSLTCVSLVPDASPFFQTLASLHLHTSPLTSITSDHTGSHLLTASWDHLIGFWDTAIPAHDEVGPTSELTPLLTAKNARSPARLRSRAENAEPPQQYSSPTRHGYPRQNLRQDRMSGRIVVGLIRRRSLNGRCSTWWLHLTDTPSSCPLLTGRSPFLTSVRPRSRVQPHRTYLFPKRQRQRQRQRYLDSERILNPDRHLRRNCPSRDLQSLKSAVTSVKAWDGTPKKILSVDWVGEVVGVGGEGGVEIWRIGQGDRVLTR
ncbi:ribosome biogenesis protein YTM1 [Lanmaoa asiatica]|nr:ribosome biogenesis protein YTM1 [Lanmaoa asiatica]